MAEAARMALLRFSEKDATAPKNRFSVLLLMTGLFLSFPFFSSHNMEDMKNMLMTNVSRMPTEAMIPNSWMDRTLKTTSVNVPMAEVMPVSRMGMNICRVANARAGHVSGKGVFLVKFLHVMDAVASRHYEHQNGQNGGNHVHSVAGQPHAQQFGNVQVFGVLVLFVYFPVQYAHVFHMRTGQICRF